LISKAICCDPVGGPRHLFDADFVSDFVDLAAVAGSGDNHDQFALVDQAHDAIVAATCGTFALEVVL